MATAGQSVTAGGKKAASSLSISPPDTTVQDTLFSPGVLTPGHSYGSLDKGKDQCNFASLPPLMEDSSKEQPKCNFFLWQRNQKKQ